MKKILSLLLSISLIFSCAGMAQARQTGEKKTYIVVLEAPAVYSPDRVAFYGTDDDVYRQALLELQAEVKSQINGGVSMFSMRNVERTYAYTDILNGFTVNVDAETAKEIEKIDGVKGVYENKAVNIIKPAETEENEVVMSTDSTQGESTQASAANSGNMINVEAAYKKGYNGEGRAIAIIDSTINPEHIYYTLADDTKAKYSQTDIGNILSSNQMNVSATADVAYRNAKIPFAYNYPENSSVVTGSNLHGTHVAGIVSGNSVAVPDGVISGVAPKAQILFFGVFSSTGETQTDDIIAALEDAVKFDVDAINISMGADFASEYMGEGPLNDAVVSCRNSGKTVVFAAGNADRASYAASFADYSASDNRNYLYSSKVGSVQSEYAYMTYFEDNAGNKYPCVAKGSKSALSALEVADCGSGKATEIAEAGVSGKIAVISMPDSVVAEGVSAYGTRAMNAGAAAVVVAYHSTDLPDGNSGVAYPLFTVSKKSGADILSTAATLKYTGEKAVLQREATPVVNTYSSYGYGDNLDIAVDFSAPGGNIYSSYGGNNGFTNLSGTSMAAPQVTGATSLMYQYVEEEFPNVTGVNKVMLVKNLLASTAETVYDSAGALVSPRKVGSGVIQLDKAMDTKILLKGKNSAETKVNLGANLTKNFDVTFTAYNLSSSNVTFENMQVELSADDYKYYDDMGYCYCGIKNLQTGFSQATPVTVPADGNVDITVTVTLSDSDITYLSTAMTNGFFIDGKVTLSGADNCDVGIPFSGFYGDWARQPIMTESRFLDYFSICGYSDDGFTPPAMIVKSDNEIVMPMSDSPDASVEKIPAAVFANSTRNTFMTVKCDGVAVLENAFVNKLYDAGYYMGEVLVGDLAEVSVITIDLRLPYESEPSQSYTIKLVEDNEMPVISDVYVKNEDGTDYTFLTASDNYGISTVTSMATNAAGETVYADVYISKSSATAAFDITDLSDLYYYVYDSAFNMTAIEPHIGISVAEGIATYTNNTHNTLTGECMIAVYEGKKMVDFKKLSENTITLAAYDAVEFDLSPYQGKTYKLFFWKDMANIVPICDAYAK